MFDDAPADVPPAVSVTDARRAVAVMERQERSRRGWSWRAAAVAGAPGWWRVWQQQKRGEGIRLGSLTFLGPGDTVVYLSSNPLIHGFTETVAVLVELGGVGLSGAELAAEIGRRTDAARNH